jgi:ketosteroid isomerase-like protein
MRWHPATDAAREGLPTSILDLIERQGRAWEVGDPDLALPDWDPNGQLTAPGACVPAAELAAEFRSFHDEHEDLRITATNVLVSGDGQRVALEWDWEVTERANGVRALTRDAILIDLFEGRIVSWREYFDPGSAQVVSDA